MAYLFQQALNALQLGSIYALIALGYTMVYGILTMINFAHGDLFMVGAFFCFLLAVYLKLSFVPTLLVSMLGVACLGVVIERLAYKPLRAAPRVSAIKPPSCSLVEFAEQSMKFGLSFWIVDPERGIGNVRSEVMLRLWDAFRIQGDSTTFPIRDLRMDEPSAAAPDIEPHLR